MTTTAPSANNLSIDGNLFIVLMNSKNEYSLWPADKGIPEGWKNANYSGSKDECKAYIDKHWLSLMPVTNKSTTEH
jgi:MbtH protein